jgi:hypothetical protein
LFVITGSAGSGKSGVLRELSARRSDLIAVDTDDWRPPPEQQPSWWQDRFEACPRGRFRRGRWTGHSASLPEGRGRDARDARGVGRRYRHLRPQRFTRSGIGSRAGSSNSAHTTSAGSIRRDSQHWRNRWSSDPEVFITAEDEVRSFCRALLLDVPVLDFHPQRPLMDSICAVAVESPPES